ncbi:MAG: spore germination protein [Bacillota bacterium]
MARSIFKKIFFPRSASRKNNSSSPGASSAGGSKLSKNLAANLVMFRDALGDSMDVVTREFYMGRTRTALLYIDCIVDRTALRENILRALMVDTHTVDPSAGPGSAGLAVSVKEKVLSVCCVKETRESNQALDWILRAHIIILFDGEDTALVLKLPGFEARTVEEPHTENVVRGPMEGFVESLHTNIAMLRRKIKSILGRRDFETAARKLRAAPARRGCRPP